jgi:hypothetical protein
MILKLFYLALTDGRIADQAWKRRCLKLLDQQDGTPVDDLSWRQTFIRFLHKRCYICFGTREESTRTYLAYGYKYLQTCVPCAYTSKKTKSIMMTEEEIYQKHDLDKNDLSFIPQIVDKWSIGLCPDCKSPECHSHTKWSSTFGYVKKELRYSKIGAAQQSILKRAEKSLEKMLNKKSSSDRSTFTDALSHVKSRTFPESASLEVCLSRVYHSVDEEQDGHFNATVSFVRSFKSVLQDLEAALLQKAGTPYKLSPYSEASPRVNDTISIGRFPCSWIDALAIGRATIPQYIQAIQAVEAKAEEQLHLLELDKTSLQLDAHIWNRPCNTEGCNASAPLQCRLSRCWRCCRGTCHFHEREGDEYDEAAYDARFFDSDDGYSDSEDEADSWPITLPLTDAEREANWQLSQRKADESNFRRIGYRVDSVCAQDACRTASHPKCRHVRCEQCCPGGCDFQPEDFSAFEECSSPIERKSANPMGDDDDDDEDGEPSDSWRSGMPQGAEEGEEDIENSPYW